MDKYQTELQELQNLDPSVLDDAQRARLAELPLLISEAEKTALQAELDQKEKDLTSALSQKEHWRTKAEAKPVVTNQTVVEPGTDPIDLIKLGKKLQDYSDDELDFVTKFAGTKKPEEVLKALENTFVQEGIRSHREKVDREKAVKPSGGSPQVEVKKSIKEILVSGTLEEKEKALDEFGRPNIPKKWTTTR